MIMEALVVMGYIVIGLLAPIAVVWIAAYLCVWHVEDEEKRNKRGEK